MDNDCGLEPPGAGGDDTMNPTPPTQFVDHNDIPEAALCSVCRPIFSERGPKFSKISDKALTRSYNAYEDIANVNHSEDGEFLGQHHISQKSLVHAQRQHCFICCRIEPSRRTYPLEYLLNRSRDGRIYRLHIKGSTRLKRVVFRLQADYPANSIQQLADRSKCRTSTGHVDAIEVAKAWLQHCLDKHSCSTPSPNQQNPTRLLDISANEIKLIQGNSKEAQHHHYATLSHCWGTGKFPRLTVKRKKYYSKGVNISEFEPTFRETIMTVRQMGIRYLWIDCYCIIQGTGRKAQADWKRESSRMGDYFANSLFNIGALDSTGPAGGLFRTRFRLNAKILWSPTSQAGLKAFYISQQSELSPVNLFRKLPAYALMRRGWVIQECVLAPRMLSFGGNEIIWQCSQLAASETYADQIQFDEDEASKYELASYPFWTFGYPRSDREASLIRQAEKQWIGTLQAYCKSSLSFPEKDIFVALNGIGTLLVKNFNGQFRHGIWDKAFPAVLLFENKAVRDKNKILLARLGPTWHWASCYPRVNFFGLKVIYNSWDIIQPMVDASFPDDYKPPPNKQPKNFWWKLRLKGRLIPEEEFLRMRYVYSSEDDNISPSQVKWYLPIIQGESYHSSDRAFYGLILIQTRSGVYRRVGAWDAFIVEAQEANKFRSRVFDFKKEFIFLE
ncbi:heterokaryon incompatibility protein-domain-containing protein [Xylaria scruposa]|nr:heterokaryon incompatibility protein-domain-containing protein [Xylaria scruposa]